MFGYIPFYFWGCNMSSRDYSVQTERRGGYGYILQSPLLPLIEDGTADLHCRSDHYLAEEICSDRAR